MPHIYYFYFTTESHQQLDGGTGSAKCSPISGLCLDSEKNNVYPQWGGKQFQRRPFRLI